MHSYNICPKCYSGDVFLLRHIAIMGHQLLFAVFKCRSCGEHWRSQTTKVNLKFENDIRPVEPPDVGRFQ
jgi:hypothetical protein